MFEQWPIKKIKVSEIKSNKRNPRTISEEELKRLKESLEGLGIFKPIILKHNYELLGGTQRIKVILSELPADFEIYASISDRERTEKEYDQIMLLDNTHFGDWDPDILANEFKLEDMEVANVSPPDMIDDVEEKEESKKKDGFFLEVELTSQEELNELGTKLTSEGYIVRVK
jgi:hypothetical protein